jgi:serine/threonine protein kinase
VYLARDVEIGRDVAVKVLPATFSSDKDRLQPFQQEACAAGALNHPNILSIYDVGRTGNVQTQSVHRDFVDPVKPTFRPMGLTVRIAPSEISSKVRCGFVINSPPFAYVCVSFRPIQASLGSC